MNDLYFDDYYNLFNSGKPENIAVPSITMDYVTDHGHGTITMKPARVFPCSAHDLNTIIDTLWKCSETWETAEIIYNYLFHVINDLQTIRNQHSMDIQDDIKARAKITGFIKKYLGNINKIASAFGFEEIQDEQSNAQKMKKCEVIAFECRNGKKMGVSYPGYSFVKNGYVFHVTKKNTKNLQTIIVPCLGLSCIDYNGTFKEAPEQIPAHVFEMLGRWTREQWETARNNFVAACAETMEYYTVPEIPASVTGEKPETAETVKKEEQTETATECKKENQAIVNQETETAKIADLASRGEIETAKTELYKLLIARGRSVVAEIIENKPGTVTNSDRAEIMKELVNSAWETVEKAFAQYGPKPEPPKPCKPYHIITDSRKNRGSVTISKQNRPPYYIGQQTAQVWKPCTMTDRGKSGIIYRIIPAHIATAEPPALELAQGKIKPFKMQGCINVYRTEKNPATGKIQALKRHKTHPETVRGSPRKIQDGSTAKF